MRLLIQRTLETGYERLSPREQEVRQFCSHAGQLLFGGAR